MFFFTVVMKIVLEIRDLCIYTDHSDLLCSGFLQPFTSKFSLHWKPLPKNGSQRWMFDIDDTKYQWSYLHLLLHGKTRWSIAHIHFQTLVEKGVVTTLFPTVYNDTVGSCTVVCHIQRDEHLPPLQHPPDMPFQDVAKTQKGLFDYQQKAYQWVRQWNQEHPQDFYRQWYLFSVKLPLVKEPYAHHHTLLLPPQTSHSASVTEVRNAVVDIPIPCLLRKIAKDTKQLIHKHKDMVQRSLVYAFVMTKIMYGIPRHRRAITNATSPTDKARFLSTFLMWSARAIHYAKDVRFNSKDKGIEQYSIIRNAPPNIVSHGEWEGDCEDKALETYIVWNEFCACENVNDKDGMKTLQAWARKNYTVLFATVSLEDSFHALCVLKPKAGPKAGAPPIVLDATGWYDGVLGRDDELTFLQKVCQQSKNASTVLPMDRTTCESMYYRVFQLFDENGVTLLSQDDSFGCNLYTYLVQEGEEDVRAIETRIDCSPKFSSHLFEGWPALSPLPCPSLRPIETYLNYLDQNSELKFLNCFLIDNEKQISKFVENLQKEANTSLFLCKGGDIVLYMPDSVVLYVVLGHKR